MEYYGPSEATSSTNVTLPSDGRLDMMREFLALEQEIAELRGMQERTAEQVEKAQFRRRELVAALHEIIDGPSDRQAVAR